MRKILISTLIIPVIFLGAGCNLLGKPAVTLKPVKLEYWRTDDDPESMAELIAAYRKTHPNVEIVYTKMANEDYEEKLLEALAEDRGPDMFSIPNVWLGGWKSKLLPLPKETVIPTMVVNEQKKIVTTNKKSPTLTILEMRNTFVETVTKDVIIKAPPEQPGGKREDKIYGLPLSLDTLVLYYNKDLLKNAGIENPPATWSDLMEQSTILTVIDEDGAVKQAGAPLGTSANVRNFFDIMSALMMQNGAVMVDDLNYASFHKFPPGASARSYPPGTEALMFYQSFAIEGAPNRSWDESMPDSLDAFVTGKTAFFFGYPVNAKEIRTRAPKLNLGVAPLPQVDVDRIVNVARYPVEVVSKKTKYVNEAWDFLEFISQQDKVSSYLFATKRPTALRALIKEQVTNPDVNVFANQILTAKSWYRGNDYAKAEDAFAVMVDTKPTIRRPEVGWLVDQAASVVNDTIN